MIPAAVADALRQVDAIRKTARRPGDGSGASPSPRRHVDATSAHVRPAGRRAMVKLQLLTGARGRRGVIMVPWPATSTDRATLWTLPTGDYHKTAHHGHDRIVYLGPKSQAVIKPFLALESERYLFHRRTP